MPAREMRTALQNVIAASSFSSDHIKVLQKQLEGLDDLWLCEVWDDVESFVNGLLMPSNCKSA
jgi:hypothetical protein